VLGSARAAERVYLASTLLGCRAYQGTPVFAPNQRVNVNLANLTIQGVQFSQNVQEALGTVLEQTSLTPRSIASSSCSASKASNGWRYQRNASGRRRLDHADDS
jgi:hypothetical protein